MSDLHSDLTARWRPSPAQVDAAERAFRSNPDAVTVVSGHFLGGKEYGIWDSDVTVEYPDVPVRVVGDGSKSAYCDVRDDVCVDVARSFKGRDGTIGYTVHRRDRDWAVFEESLPLSRFLDDEPDSFDQHLMSGGTVAGWEMR